MCCENNGCIDYARLVHGIVGLLAHTQEIQSSKKAEEPLIITIGALLLGIGGVRQ